MRFKEEVVIVTGSGSGIGKAAALLFAKEGAKVVVNDEHGDEAKETAGLIKNGKGKAIAVQADVSKWQEVEKMVNKTLETYGRIDVLVNNVGAFQTFNFIESTEEQWEFLYNNILKSTMICTRLVLPHMLKAGKGKIVNVGSISGMVATPMVGDVYGAFKSGVFQFTKALGADYIAKNININCVSPGVTDTPLIASLKANPDVLKGILNLIPQERLGTPEEVANVILFMASEEVSRICGVNLPVTGGHELGGGRRYRAPSRKG